ncbi:uncharacterized protein LOC127797506 isoform X2 [Diospyros lotus]|uniref:uncharacterized protein LOC127797506 isoform X2 n=1 Tax=Diospyros lotus TaxID=55363 RepID=UPI002259A091|nr:uncharacterized protein LOC127797506 isoform X2 [Diospyros lotus]
MANGADAEDYVVLSRVRPGLKRELAFALKSQAEYAGSIGRTRARRSPFGAVPCDKSKNSSNKKLKSAGSKNVNNDVEKHPVGDQFVIGVEKSMINEAMNVKCQVESGAIGDDADRVVSVSEDEPKSDVVDLASDDEQKSVLVESAAKEVEPMFMDLPEVEDLGKVCSSDEPSINGEAKKGKLEPLCKVESTMQTENLVPEAELANEVVEKGFNERPIMTVTSSSVNLMAEPLEKSASEKVDTARGAESNATGKLKMKMSKKIALKRFPTKLKELLETGLLEGLAVKYLRGVKTRGLSDMGLEGIIKGTGILCSCEMCDGTQVVSPNQFELHAGSANKRPPDYIHLKNGNTLRDVLNACKNASTESLEVTILNAIGRPYESRPTLCLNCKGPIPEAGLGRTMMLCNSCWIPKDSQPSPAPLTNNGSSPKSSDSASFSNSSRSKIQGRLTRKDLRLHKLVFDALEDGTAVAYFARGQKCAEGYKKGYGLFCYCCNSEVSPSQFEAHAGWASRRKPYLHIYMSNGVSLHEFSVRLCKERKLSPEENDDLCSICADGGDLLCCDSCPRAFHTECISLSSVPCDSWYCRYCQNMFQKEKFVERNANALAAGRVAGIDPMEQITLRCIRIVETAESDVGGCALCRGHDFSKSGFGARTVILCDQCEKEYHVGCLKEHNMDDLKELPMGQWFCCKTCNSVHSALQQLVASGEEKLPESTLSLIKQKLEQKGSESVTDLDLTWRLLSGKMASDEKIRLLLSKAVSIFHDRFDPIAYSNTGSLDFIPHMVYGRNVRDQEFGGMYCAVLSVNSTVVSAGVIRVFGEEVAELPLVATSTDYEGQGYFQALFSCIENLLGLLNVKKLVLPAAYEAECIWTNKFGFEKMTEEELMKYRRDYQMLIFQGTSMLHKPIPKP